MLLGTGVAQMPNDLKRLPMNFSLVGYLAYRHVSDLGKRSKFKDEICIGPSKLKPVIDWFREYA
jgi:hypothetical protein